ELYAKAQAMVRRLDRFCIEHVLREKNREADRLVNKVLDERGRQK
ncbi:MAG: reverse transcriptase-like protein, partial [Candidatus Angelobacter sp.]